MLGEWMEKEILQQPAVLGRGLTSYRQQIRPVIEGRRFDMVLLVARGSSDNAAITARYWIEAFAGIPVSLAAPSVLTRYESRVRYRNCLAIGISQSGSAPDVAEVLGYLREEQHTTLAITNTPGSLITQEAAHFMLLDCGEERSVAATKTYTASLLALYEVARCLAPHMPEPMNQMPREEWMRLVRKKAEETSGVVVRSNPVFALGRGFGFGTALETALKLMECALIPAKPYSSADFEHGPKALAGYGTAAISYEGPMPQLEQQGCMILEAPKPELGVPPPLMPFWDIMYGQFLALLAARARGLDPDDPQHIQKVTSTF